MAFKVSLSCDALEHELHTLALMLAYCTHIQNLNQKSLVQAEAPSIGDDVEKDGTCHSDSSGQLISVLDFEKWTEINITSYSWRVSTNVSKELHIRQHKHEHVQTIEHTQTPFQTCAKC